MNPNLRRALELRELWKSKKEQAVTLPSDVNLTEDLKKEMLVVMKKEGRD